MTELCPHCREAREMTRTSTTDEQKLADGSTKKIRIDVFHCATCTGFVRSEESDVADSR